MKFPDLNGLPLDFSMERTILNSSRWLGKPREANERQGLSFPSCRSWVLIISSLCTTTHSKHFYQFPLLCTDMEQYSVIMRVIFLICNVKIMRSTYRFHSPTCRRELDTPYNYSYHTILRVEKECLDWGIQTLHSEHQELRPDTQNTNLPKHFLYLQG